MYFLNFLKSNALNYKNPKTMNKFVLLCLITFALVGCKKFEEGPRLSLKSKTARVANEWQVESYLDKSNDKTALFSASTIELTKSESVTITTPNGVYTGTWEFDEEDDDDDEGDDDVELEIKLSSKDAIASELEGDWTITRLKENEMWLRDDDDNSKLIRLKEK